MQIKAFYVITSNSLTYENEKNKKFVNKKYDGTPFSREAAYNLII